MLTIAAFDALSASWSTRPTRGSRQAGSRSATLTIWAAESMPIGWGGTCRMPMSRSISVRSRRYSAPRACPSKRPRAAKESQLSREAGGRHAGLFGVQAGVAQRPVELVPLDLEADQRRQEVVDVGRRREEHGQRARAVVVPGAAPGRRLDPLPAVHVGAQGIAKAAGAL